MTTHGANTSRWLARASLAAYVASLCVPAYRTDYYGGPQSHFGIEALLLGPIGLFAGHISWIANPVLWQAWRKRTSSSHGLSFALALLAFVIAASFLLGKTVAVGSAGEYAYHATFGFYLWLVSMVLAAAAAWSYSSSEEGGGSENAL